MPRLNLTVPMVVVLAMRGTVVLAGDESNRPASPPPPPDMSNFIPMRIESIPAPLTDRASRKVIDKLSSGQALTVVVTVCVLESGALNGKPTLKQSSGSTEADAAALSLAAQGRYRPPTLAGRAIRGCSPLPIHYASVRGQ